MPVGAQIAILYCGIHGLLRDVPLEKVTEFQELFLEQLRNNYQTTVIDVLASGNINDEVTTLIEKVAADIALTYKNK